jgi:nicotinamidase-related amidase
MPRDLQPLLLPGESVAVMVVEMQRLTMHTTNQPTLAEHTRELVAPIASLTEGAREVGAQVMYTLIAHRDDGRTRGRRDLQANAAMNPNGELAEGLRFDQRDFLLYRWHGMNPVYDTGVETMLRHMGVRTVVLAGVSLNVSLLGSAIDLYSGGFEVVIPRDCVAAVTKEYGDMVLQNTMRAIATLTTKDDVLATWEAGHSAWS